jgi:transcription initiation factor IIE alpha subunit
MLPLDDNVAVKVRATSRELFGSAHRLEVAAAIAEARRRPVYSRQISEQIGANQNQVGEVLRHFENAHLLKRLPSRRGREPQKFQPVQSDYWTLCRRVLKELTDA